MMVISHSCFQTLRTSKASLESYSTEYSLMQLEILYLSVLELLNRVRLPSLSTSNALLALLTIFAFQSASRPSLGDCMKLAHFTTTLTLVTWVIKHGKMSGKFYTCGQQTPDHHEGVIRSFSLDDEILTPRESIWSTLSWAANWVSTRRQSTRTLAKQRWIDQPPVSSLQLEKYVSSAMYAHETSTVVTLVSWAHLHVMQIMCYSQSSLL